MIQDELYSLQSLESLEFFKKHRHDDPQEFALKFSSKEDLPIRAIAEQIKCYQKAKKKIPTLAKHHLIYESVAIEQCSSEATALYKQSLMSGKRLIDLTGGLGIDDIYLSETFTSVIHCERNPVLSNIVAHNMSQLENTKIKTFTGDSIPYLESFEDGYFDWIYIDPARRDSTKRFVRLDECVPDVIEHQDLFFKKAKKICIKASPAIDFTSTKRQFTNLKEFIVVSVNNECKEILLILDQTEPIEQIEIKAVMIDAREQKTESFQKHEKSYYQKEESPTVLRYFYEPDGAIIKSRLAAKLAFNRGIVFINTSVDYMTSDRIIEDFPGRRFIVKEVVPYQKKTLKNFLKLTKITKANVARRDFPDSPEYIKKVFKLKDGGNEYLFFTKNSFGECICIHCHRL